MKRLAALCVLLAAGCSTSPLADFMDFVRPARMPSGQGRYYGGVGNLQVPPPPTAAPGDLPPPAPPPVTTP
jgi:hypothetical protein